jgi:hypothetical protein
MAKMRGWRLAICLLLALLGCEGKTRPYVLVAPLQGDDEVVSASDAGSPSESGDSAEASGQALLSVSPNVLDFGPVVIGVATLGRIAIWNIGIQSMPAPRLEWVVGSDPDFAVAQNLCSATIAAGEHCDVRLQVMASKAGPLAATLHIASDAGETADLPLSAEGLSSGELVLAPAEGNLADFGGVTVGSAAQATFELTNPTSGPSGPITVILVNSAFKVLDPGPATDCVPELGLAAATTCQIHVSFSPTERGRIDAALVVQSDSLGSTSLSLSGQGHIAGTLGLSTERVDFPGVVVGAAERVQVAVQNQGDEPLTLASIALEGDVRGEYSISSSECAPNQVLQAGESCSVELQFAPSMAASDGTANLVVTSTGGNSKRLPLSGSGLLPGTLVIEPIGDSPVDFGSVLLNSSAVHIFRVRNPGAEPSGQLTITGSNSFAVLPSNPGECEQGVTSLVNNESCSFRVSLTPTQRAPQTGAITASSVFAGSSTFTLTGRGIVPALVKVQQQQVNFDRLVIGSTAQATVTISNDGDLPLNPPVVTVVDPAGGAARGFSAQSNCAAPLNYQQSCGIIVTFNPTAPGSYSMRLQVTSDSSQASSLLTGTAVARGQLTLDAAVGGGAFGDVVIGAVQSRTYTVRNPGGVAAGRLTITSSLAPFAVDPGTCANAMGAGLVDGGSCQFSVAFRPVSSDALSATISIRSVSAGEASLSLSGRGRRPATLAGSSALEFNSVIVGENSASRAWSVTNTGDLATGALTVTASSGDVTFANNTCVNALAAGAACSMNVLFHPLAAGSRSATLTVHDSNGNRPDAVLTVTGTGQVLPSIGQACTGGSRCAQGGSCENSSNGTSRVCCGADCTGNQSCSQSQNFRTCELPTVPVGAACAVGTNTCAAGVPCTNGICQAPTVGNGAACGVNASCDSTLGLQCLGSGTCGCPAGRHFCSGGSASCSANNDTTHCAVTSTTCTDCTQANANAACGGTGCNNTCRGTTLSCPGTGGKPNCGSWDFETGTQGWVAGPGTVGAMTIRVSAAQRVSGTNSLAVTFSPPFLPDGSVTNGSYRIQVSLCGGSAIDLRGKRLQAQIFIDADPENTLPAASANTYDTPRAAPVALNSVSLTTGVWTSVTTDPLPAGSGVSSETNIGFEVDVKFGSSPTSGTIFFDDISVL